MKKLELLHILEERLSAFPKQEIYKVTSYYSEMIEDRIEDGMDEDAAVAAMGNPDDIIHNAVLDMPFPTLIRANVNQSREQSGNKALWITLAIAGFPLWLPILIALIVVVFAFYVVVWSIIVALYSAVLGMGIGGAAGTVCGIIACFVANPAAGLCLCGCGLVCLALALACFRPMVKLTKLLIHGTALVLRGIKSLFVRKERA